MEKFSQWRDGATGIAPFLPHARPISFDSKFLNSISRIFVVISVVFTLPWVIFSFLLYFSIIQFIPVYIVRKLFLRYNVLLSLRVMKIDVSFETRGKNSIPNRNVIVTNFSSPFDPIIYATILDDPVFLFPTKSQKFLQYTLFSSIIRSMSDPTELSGGIELAKVVSSSRPTVIFIEGTTSNGKGLLPFVCDIPIASLSSSTTIHPTVLKYTPSSGTTPVPTSLPSWIYSILSTQTSISARIKFANQLSTNASSDERAINNEISDAICRVGRIRKLGGSLNLESKRDFIRAWYKGRS